MLKKIVFGAFLMSTSLHAHDYAPYYPLYSNPNQNDRPSKAMNERYYPQEVCAYPPPTPDCTTSTYPYEAYPGLAYEDSISTFQVVTTAVVGIALIALIVVAFKNTPCNSHCH